MRLLQKEGWGVKLKRGKTKRRMPKVFCKDWKDSGLKIGCGEFCCEKEICLVGKGELPKIGLKFQVADV